MFFLNYWLLALLTIFKMMFRSQHNIVSKQLYSFPLNPFPHSDTFWRVWERSLLKKLWEKEKLLVQAISPFPTIFFYSIKGRNYHFCYIQFVVCKCFQFGLVKILSCGKGLPIIKAMISGEKVLNPVAVNVLNPWTGIGWARDGTSDPLIYTTPQTHQHFYLNPDEFASVKVR